MNKDYRQTIDAQGQTLGRLAGRIAILLRGKHRPDFKVNRQSPDVVWVKNVGQIVLTGNKKESKKYFSHSGFPKGEKTTSLKKILARDPAEILRRAVWGMLPPNRQRRQIIKRLKFE